MEAFSVLDNLNVYIEEENKQYRQKAIKKIVKIFQKISIWYGGDLELGQNVIGQSIKDFQTAFKKRLLTAIKIGEKEDLETVFQILEDFSRYLLKSNPEIQDLDKLTKGLNEKINLTIPEETEKQSSNLGLLFVYFKKSPTSYIIAVIVFYCVFPNCRLH